MDMARVECGKRINFLLSDIDLTTRNAVWSFIDDIEKLAKKKAVEEFVNSPETKKYFEEIQSEQGEGVRVITDRSLFFAADAFIEKL